MSELLLDIRNAANWQAIYDETFTAPNAGQNRFYPLQPVVIPILIDSPVIALGASSVHAPPYWQFGYWARQYWGGTGIGAIEGRSYKAMLNRLMICRFPSHAQQYQIRIEIPYWHRSMSVGLWEYTGPLNDSTETLIQEQTDLIRVDLVRIETKIDAL